MEGSFQPLPKNAPNARAKGLIHRQAPMNRAFSPLKSNLNCTWGCAPGWDEPRRWRFTVSSPVNRLLASLDPVVHVAVAGGPQGLVVKGLGAGGFFQLFAEPVDVAQMVGGSRNLQAAGLEKLLVAAV